MQSHTLPDMIWSNKNNLVYASLSSHTPDCLDVLNVLHKAFRGLKNIRLWESTRHVAYWKYVAWHLAGMCLSGWFFRVLCWLRFFESGCYKFSAYLFQERPLNETCFLNLLISLMYMKLQLQFLVSQQDLFFLSSTHLFVWWGRGLKREAWCQVLVTRLAQSTAATTKDLEEPNLHKVRVWLLMEVMQHPPPLSLSNTLALLVHVLNWLVLSFLPFHWEAHNKMPPSNLCLSPRRSSLSSSFTSSLYDVLGFHLLLKYGWIFLFTDHERKRQYLTK